MDGVQWPHQATQTSTPFVIKMGNIWYSICRLGQSLWNWFFSLFFYLQFIQPDTRPGVGLCILNKPIKFPLRAMHNTVCKNVIISVKSICELSSCTMYITVHQSQLSLIFKNDFAKRLWRLDVPVSLYLC